MLDYDYWLKPWLPELEARRGPALDVGCGPGLDVQYLLEHGFEVEACDINPEACRKSQERNPEARHRVVNARTLAGYSDAAFSIVTACLSLHYFDRDQTLDAFQSVARVLKPDGLFLFRLNAWDDYAYGAPQEFRAWHLIEFRDKQKQFFTEAMVREVVTPSFGAHTLVKTSSVRYGMPKSFLEGSARQPRVSSGGTRPNEGDPR